MRDMQEVLSRWGVWARDNSNVDYSHISPMFRGLMPYASGELSCCDDDGIVIDSCIGKLKEVRRQEELNVIIMHYIHRKTKTSIAEIFSCSEKEIRRQLQVAETFIDGCLSMIGATLEMDPYVQYEPRKVKID